MEQPIHLKKRDVLLLELLATNNLFNYSVSVDILERCNKFFSLGVTFDNQLSFVDQNSVNVSSARRFIDRFLRDTN